jgi:hypothetical protein
MVSFVSGMFHKVVSIVSTFLGWAFFASILLLGFTMLVLLPIIITHNSGTLIVHYQSSSYRSDHSGDSIPFNVSLSECCIAMIKEAREEVSVSSVFAHCSTCWIGWIIDRFSNIDKDIKNIMVMITTMGRQQQQHSDKHGNMGHENDSGLFILKEFVELVHLSYNMVEGALTDTTSFIFSHSHLFCAFPKKTGDHNREETLQMFHEALVDQDVLICTPNANNMEEDKECIKGEDIIKAYKRLNIPLRFRTFEKQQQQQQGGGGASQEAKDEV